MYAFERDVIEFAGELFGEEGKKIVRFLMKNPWSTDEEISAALRMRVNVVRKVLYDLSAWNGVEVRKLRRGEGRDFEFRWALKYDGFYRKMVSYYSSLAEDAERGAGFLRDMSLYSCGRGAHPLLTLDEAFEYDFRCPLCGELLYEVDVSNEVEEMLKRAAEFRKMVEAVEKHYRRFVRGALGRR